ncbi:deoxyuridine 5'-triphosphate nucleotidohydrolase [Bacteriophage Eos]|nr:deoxyuridine 5'-triphosphate nucleotidohydrolase [Bacteriophage Eos]
MKIKLSNPECMPKVGSETAAGMDLRCFFGTRANDILRAIGPKSTLDIDTGVAVQIPEGWCGIVVPRSSLGARQLMLTNTVGVIDSDYTGNIRIKLYNYGSETQTIENFERLCQLVVVPHWNPNSIQVVDSLDETARGDSGFGHSGRI